MSHLLHLFGVDVCTFASVLKINYDNSKII